MNSLTPCERCERLFITEDLHPAGLCNMCHDNLMPQWAIDLAKELRALPAEADLFAWARRIVKATGEG